MSTDPCSTMSFRALQVEVRVPEKGLENVPEGTKLLAILDENWPAYLEETRCEVRNRLNRWIVPLDPEATRDGEAVFSTVIRQVTNSSTRTGQPSESELLRAISVQYQLRSWVMILQVLYRFRDVS